MKRFNINAVSSPILQTAILLKPDDCPRDELTAVVLQIISNKHIPEVERVMIELIWRNGLRVSELLRIKGTDVMSNGSFIIHASKHSENRIGFIVDGLPFLESWRGVPAYIFDCYDRHFVYYMFKRLGISSNIKGNSNRAVTHVLRHQAIENINRATNSSEATAQVIGHRSKRSTEHYLNHIIQPEKNK